MDIESLKTIGKRKRNTPNSGDDAPRDSLKARLRGFDHTTHSVMIRGLDGNISFWNKAAEKHYGWTRGDAVGNVSHQLLNTVFPCPLEEINAHLLANGCWEGELIHTISDGVRVRVLSRWELANSSSSERRASVVEINKVSEVINPQTAHFKSNNQGRLVLKLWERKWWFVIPFFTLLFLFVSLLVFTHERQLLPIVD